RLVRGGVAALEDAGPLDDPVGVEPEAGVEVVVADDHVRDVFAGPDNPDAHQGPAPRPRQGSFAAHRFDIRLAPAPPTTGGREGLYEVGRGQWVVDSEATNRGAALSFAVHDPLPTTHYLSAPLPRKRSVPQTPQAVASRRRLPSVADR